MKKLRKLLDYVAVLESDYSHLVAIAILAALAAVTIPQFVLPYKLGELPKKLAFVRGNILLYKTQHDRGYPDSIEVLTRHFDGDGNASETPGPKHPYGYLLTVPANPVTGSMAVRVVSGAETAFSPPDKDGGWWYNRSTGEFRAYMTDGSTDGNGMKLNEL